MKPLFIPLKKEYFSQFERGKKTIEYRAYGKRWNEKVCVTGRAVTLSLGYSGKRLAGSLSKFVVVPAEEAVSAAKKIYPTATQIACLHITLHT